MCAVGMGPTGLAWHQGRQPATGTRWSTTAFAGALCSSAASLGLEQVTDTATRLGRWMHPDGISAAPQPHRLHEASTPWPTTANADALCCSAGTQVPTPGNTTARTGFFSAPAKHQDQSAS